MRSSASTTTSIGTPASISAVEVVRKQRLEGGQVVDDSFAFRVRLAEVVRLPHGQAFRSSARVGCR
jgi:hypothetical protein